MDGSSRITSVQQELERFQRTLCHPAMPPLVVVHARDRCWTDTEYRSKRPAGFPSKFRGVYLFFDDDERLMYVGVAMGSYYKRVRTHEGRIQQRYIDIVPFDDTWLPLALALEYWLIQAFTPPGNTTYRNYGLACDVGHEPIPNAAKLPSG